MIQIKEINVKFKTDNNSISPLIENNTWGGEKNHRATIPVLQILRK